MVWLFYIYYNVLYLVFLETVDKYIVNSFFSVLLHKELCTFIVLIY